MMLLINRLVSYTANSFRKLKKSLASILKKYWAKLTGVGIVGVLYFVFSIVPESYKANKSFYTDIFNAITFSSTQKDKMSEKIIKTYINAGKKMAFLKDCYDMLGNLTCSNDELQSRTKDARNSLYELRDAGNDMYATFSLAAHDKVFCFIQNSFVIIKSKNFIKDYNLLKIDSVSNRDKLEAVLKQDYDGHSLDTKKHRDRDQLLLKKTCTVTKHQQDEKK